MTHHRPTPPGRTPLSGRCASWRPALALWALGLLAATPAHAERPVTYREALEAALDANPTLQRSQLSRDQAQAGLVAASGGFDPIYNANAFYAKSTSQQFFPGFGSQSFDNRSWGLTNSVSGTAMTGTTLELSHNFRYNQYENPLTDEFGNPAGVVAVERYNGDLTASVTQKLLRGLSFKYNLENVTVARRNVDVADLSLEQMRQDTLARAAQAYWTWVYQASVAEIQRNSVAVAQEALRVGELKVDAGELAPVEKTRLQAALVQAQANALESENQAEQAANDLLLTMGERPDQALVPATPAGDVPTWELDVDKAIEVAKAQNLDLVVARANLETAEIQRKNGAHGRLPDLSATLELGRTVQNAEDAATAMDLFGTPSDPTLLVSGNLTVPLLNRSARGLSQQDQVLVAQRRSELEELERSIAAQVEQQVRTLQSARRRVELADANVALAEQTLAAEQALSDAGRSIQKDVLEARTEVDRTRAEAAKARTDYRVAQTELLRLQGQLSPDAAPSN